MNLKSLMNVFSVIYVEFLLIFMPMEFHIYNYSL